MTIFGYIIFILLGLIIGSFLNVVIYRLPRMMKHEWHLESCDILGIKTEYDEERVTLSTPRSHCTQCNTPLKIWHNIPLLSFFMLSGKCGYCGTKISWQYPIIEALSAIVAAVIFWRFQFSWAMGCALIFSWGLIATSAIDIKEKFIPDSITYSLLWLGLLANAFSVYTTPKSAILGAIVAYLFFWSIAKLFLIIRKKEGLGYGDFKLLAMLACWLGIGAIINIILISSIVGIVVSCALLLNKKLNFSTQIPFGPFLALGGWCTMVFGSFITNAIIQ